MYSLLILQLFKLKKKKIIFIFMMVAIFLVYKATFRESGIDYESYIRNYNEVQLLGFDFFKRRIEPLFKLILYVSPNFRVAFFIVAFIAICLKLKGIVDYSLYPFISLVFYYYSYYYSDDMGRIRIGIASAIMLFAIRYLEQKKFLIYITIAILLHKSTITYIILYFFYKLNLNKKQYIILFFISFILSVIDMSVIRVILSKIPYLNSTIIEYMAIFQKVGFTLYMLPKILFMILFFSKFKYLSKFKYFRKLYSIYFLGNFIYFTFSSIQSFATRGSETLLCVEFIILPYLIKAFKDKIIRFLIFIILIIYYTYTAKEYMF